jgi:hypothetical protein
MQANEIRLGNLVKATKSGGYNNIGDVIAITSINLFTGVNEWQDMGASGYIPFDGIVPVPLLRFNLLPLGFTPAEDSYRLTIHGNRELAIYSSEGFVRYQTKSEGFTTALKHIQYVHQLQNLYFSLTGSELRATSVLY